MSTNGGNGGGKPSNMMKVAAALDLLERGNFMIRKTFSIFGAAIGLALLAACSLTTEQTAAVEKAYDTTCRQEPALYQTFVVVAVAKQASDKTLAKAAAVHQAAIGLCETRPKDIASAAVQLAALYAQLVTISAQVDKLPPPRVLPSTS